MPYRGSCPLSPFYYLLTGQGQRPPAVMPGAGAVQAPVPIRREGKNMKNAKLRLLFTGLIMLAALIPASAQERSAEEKKLEAVSGELDKKYSEGQQRVTDKIAAEFGVDSGLVLGLGYKKMSYGEIAIALSLAQGLHSTIRDEDLRRIVALRQGPPVMGWGKVAKELGLKLGPVLSRVRKLAAEVRRDEKADKAKEKKKNEDEKNRKKESTENPDKTGKAGMKSLSRK